MGLFTLKQSPLLVTGMIPLVVLTVVFYKDTVNAYGERSRFLPLTLALTSERKSLLESKHDDAGEQMAAADNSRQTSYMQESPLQARGSGLFLPQKMCLALNSALTNTCAHPFTQLHEKSLEVFPPLVSPSTLYDRYHRFHLVAANIVYQ